MIPARDEARNLPRLLRSIAAQNSPDTQVIVVDDNSTDGTAELARREGACVVSAPARPSGWRGKPWACTQGARAATGRVLLFLDADTWLQPGGLGRLWAAWQNGQEGALSLAPWHLTARPYEDLSAFFQIMMVAGSGAFTWRGDRRAPDGLFGPCLLVAREAYERVGGHEIVRDKILEHFHLAEYLEREGAKCRCLGGRGVLNVRMYPDGPGSLASGWAKAFASGAARVAPWILILTVLWVAGAILAAGWVAAAAWTGAGAWLAAGLALYAMYALRTASMLRPLGTFRPVTATLYPVALLFYLAVFARSALGPEIAWKGRRGVEGGP